jgi:hypothetical protein
VRRGRIYLGRDVTVLRETREGVELDGRMRLRPGFTVDLVSARSTCEAPSTRQAQVMSWWIRDVGSGGPRYRGFCRWDSDVGHQLPAFGGGPHHTTQEH